MKSMFKILFYEKPTEKIALKRFKNHKSSIISKNSVSCQVNSFFINSFGLYGKFATAFWKLGGRKRENSKESPAPAPSVSCEACVVRRQRRSEAKNAY